MLRLGVIIAWALQEGHGTIQCQFLSKIKIIHDKMKETH